MKNLVWITGAAGLIGNYLVQTAARCVPSWRVRGVRRHDFDLLDFKAVHNAFESERPGLMIHCAALSKSTECQVNPDLARRVNVDGTALLAELAAEIPFFFFSTDLVFDGRKGNYTETDAPNPLSIYAETKLAAEERVLRNPKHTVIRTSLNGGTSPSGDRGFNEQLRCAFEAGKKVTLFTDEFRSPIIASETACAVWDLAAQNQTGLFHIAGSERLSRWQIGQLVAGRWPQLKPQLIAESLKGYQGAPRAPDTSLNCRKATKLLSAPLPGLTEWLAAHPEEIF